MEEKFGISTKKYMLKELKENFGSSKDFIITNYKGLKSPDIEKLRRDLAKVSSRYVVVKNAIAKHAFDELGLKDLTQFLKGEVGISFTDDVIKAARAFVSFARDHKTLKLNCAFIDGKVEVADRIKHLAMLPSREALLGMVVTYIKSPITGFAGVLNGLLRNLVHVINEIGNKRKTKN